MSKQPLPQHFIDQWPEVLNEIDIKVIPTQYLRAIEVTFDDENVWVLEPDDPTEEAHMRMEEVFEDFFAEYEENIVGVQFILDVEKVKRDVKKRTDLFMKKKK